MSIQEEADLGHAREMISLRWPGNTVVFPWWSCRRWLVREWSVYHCVDCTSYAQTLDKRWIMDAWMDGTYGDLKYYMKKVVLCLELCNKKTRIIVLLIIHVQVLYKIIILAIIEQP